MEKTVNLVADSGILTRSYTKKDGSTAVFKYRTLTLTDGIDTFAADLVGDMVETQLDPQRTHRVQSQIKCFKWADRNGEQKYSNEIRITSIS